MREATEAMRAVVAGQSISPILLLEAEFASGVVNLWTGFGPLSWDGKTWQGGGNLLEVSQVQETTTTRAAGVSVSLSGIPSEMIALALGEHYQGRPARVWFGVLNESGALMADPMLVFSGRMDVMNIDEGGETSTIGVTVENRLIDLNRPREIRYTHEAQQALYPGDKGFEFVSALQDKEVQWGTT